MNRLKNQRVYLAGAMDRVPDRGSTWRDNVTPFLQDLGVVVFNPIKKPSVIGMEDAATHELKAKLKNQERYEGLSQVMKVIRSVDLRLVDISDFLIVNLDLDIHPCGTYEEIFSANRCKKPILIHVEQGKINAPDWIFGAIPHQMIFSSWDDLKNYLKHIDNDENIESYRRWQFFSI